MRAFLVPCGLLLCRSNLLPSYTQKILLNISLIELVSNFVKYIVVHIMMVLFFSLYLIKNAISFKKALLVSKLIHKLQYKSILTRYLKVFVSTPITVFDVIKVGIDGARDVDPFERKSADHFYSQNVHSFVPRRRI